MSNYESFQDKMNYYFKNIGNKQLALVGDAVLRLCVLDEWFSTESDTDVATNEHLKNVAKEWGLKEYIKENPSQEDKEAKTTLASTVEGIIGAVWVDSDRDFGAVQRVIKKLVY
ncbi:uncharacterized protein BDZ99DRAFT_512179 [Mytilinidion resinicola]|uniref:RNase III domain-containing protein n=1 Tax=Mytilinidion resinicola TaxID=574789 RepID=A0A6A6Y606_9PEZI|nr:uncharacterized protein BDZ99DRAFT_512179 [Mytilinidion resinicola]KAF2803434.1 hypothetical protein BDZ99DRAFT_512179 [Mytilinidion resinicola]